MSELGIKDRILPSLLDRLADDEPGNLKESRDQRIFSVARMRQCVLRDLAWLFNTGALESGVDLDKFPQVRRSVINFGLRDLEGVVLSGLDTPAIEWKVRQVITDFEPRINPDTLRVSARSATGQMNQNALSFIIEGDLWAHPAPLHLYIRSDFDLETGQVFVNESGG